MKTKILLTFLMFTSFNITAGSRLWDEDEVDLPDTSREGIFQAFVERRITIPKARRIMYRQGFSPDAIEEMTKILTLTFHIIVMKLAQESREEKARELYLSLVTPPANATVFSVAQTPLNDTNKK